MSQRLLDGGRGGGGVAAYPESPKVGSREASTRQQDLHAADQHKPRAVRLAITVWASQVRGTGGIHCGALSNSSAAAAAAATTTVTHPPRTHPVREDVLAARGLSNAAGSCLSSTGTPASRPHPQPVRPLSQRSAAPASLVDREQSESATTRISIPLQTTCAARRKRRGLCSS